MQNDFHFHIDLAVPRRTLTVFLATAILITVAPEIGSENVTLSTYYPAPSGVYNRMITTGPTYLNTTGLGNTITGTGGFVTIGTNAAIEPAVAGGMLHIRGGGIRIQHVGQLLNAYSAANVRRFGIGYTAGNVVEFSRNPTGAAGADTNFMTIDNNTAGTIQGEVTFAGGHVSIGESNLARGGTAQRSYLYINGSGAGCDSFPRSAAPGATGLCAATQYATFTQGIFINGVSSQALGSDTLSIRTGGVASGTKTPQVLTQTPGVTWNGFADTNWGTLTSGSGRVQYFCCTK